MQKFFMVSTNSFNYFKFYVYIYKGGNMLSKIAIRARGARAKKYCVTLDTKIEGSTHLRSMIYIWLESAYPWLSFHS